MDGVHDLGGVQGFGPVKIDTYPGPFKHPWEGRVYGLNAAISGDPGWTIDWWRHVRELIVPLDYLSRPYFDQWAQIYAALLIDSGMASLEEVVRGKADGKMPGAGTPMGAADVPAAAKRSGDFTRRTKGKPAFAEGAQVRTRSTGAPGHTRLPRYARGKRGTIHAYRGNHVLPDASAKGEEGAEPLYTVGFAAAELWPEASARKDRVFLDLWESYLER